MRIYPRHELVADRARALERVCKIVAEVEKEHGGKVDSRTHRYRNTAADARVLRMIPCVAEGVSGTAPGTDPFAEYARTEQRILRGSSGGPVYHH